jgi:hypothetical protein
MARPQTRLQNKQGHTASQPEDDMIIEKNEYQNTKQFYEIRHVVPVSTANLGDDECQGPLKLPLMFIRSHLANSASNPLFRTGML